jgi:hypothetical protein
MSFKNLLLSSFITAFTQTASAVEVINVASDSWQDFVNSDGTGYYLDLLHKVFPAPEYKINLSIVPYSRSIYMVNSGKSDIVLGIWANEHPHSQLSKYPVEVDLYDALMRFDHRKITGPKSFNELRVLARVGYGIDELLDSPRSYDEKVDMASMIKMIHTSRADVLFDFRAELKANLIATQLESELVIIENALSEYAFIGFCSSPRCAILKRRFDQEFLQLHYSGTIKKLLFDNHQPGSATPELISIDELFPTSP